ncbi:putative NODE_70, whole genome shotgun sequence [Denitratisoma oestradiolicum]|uniref:Putative NODE_70, whole genome shotgun sequence n=1 Tax=Denitratisoma oestradiolicum TaxID=311182 RepID=A0A6S6XU36_9PROT|nr:hypothetical protein CBW56_13080 [Denitratisoma oestradiolicum]CAB1369540.1 putative NODE_70, whole genome shotgun sequence [Denitratisoma oestradiolicum]
MLLPTRQPFKPQRQIVSPVTKLNSGAIEFRQLRCFVVVVESGNFSRGAARLGISQQAVSQLIRSLESAVGARILERGARKVIPTPLGRLMLRHARTIVEEVSQLELALAQELSSDHYKIKLGAGPTASIQLVSETLLSMKRNSVSLSVDVISAVHHTAIEALLRGDLDIFVGLDNGEAPDQGLVRHVLGMETYCVIAGSHHDFSKRQGISLRELAVSSWVLGHHLGTVQDEWRTAFIENGFDVPSVEITTSSLEFCKTMLFSNPYLTILPVQLVENELENEMLRCIDSSIYQWQRPIALLHCPKALDNLAVSLLIDGLRQSAKKIYSSC